MPCAASTTTRDSDARAVTGVPRIDLPDISDRTPCWPEAQEEL